MIRFLLILSLLVTGCAPGNRAQWRDRPGVDLRAVGGSRDGKFVFVAADGVITSRDAATGEIVARQPYKDFEPVSLVGFQDRMVAFSQEGSEVLWWPDEHLEKLEKAGTAPDTPAEKNLELTLPGPDRLSTSVAVTGAGLLEDGTLAVSDSSGRIDLWKLGVREIKITTRGQVAGSVLSPDGRTLVLVDAKKMHFFRLPQAQKFGEFEHKGSLRGLTFSPDGAHVAAILEIQVKLINTANLTSVASLPGVTSRVSFSPNGRYVSATNVGSVDVWDLTLGRAVGSVSLLSVVQSELLGTGPHLVTLREKSVDLWSLEKPEEPIWSYHIPVRMMRPKPDGIWLYTSTGWLESWRLPLHGLDEPP
jgi:WD40 repeat protein